MNPGEAKFNRLGARATGNPERDRLGGSSPLALSMNPKSSHSRKLTFGEHDVHAALQGLSRKLAEQGVHGAEIRILGSVALICALPGTRRLTTDFDAISATPAFRVAAVEVGRTATS